MMKLLDVNYVQLSTFTLGRSCKTHHHVRFKSDIGIAFDDYFHKRSKKGIIAFC